MIKSIAGVVIALGISAAVFAEKTPGKCPLHQTLSQRLALTGDHAAAVEAEETEFKAQMEALHRAHHAKLAAILTPEELAQLDAMHREGPWRGDGPKHCDGHKGDAPPKSPL